jgi:hypothetical protein
VDQASKKNIAAYLVGLLSKSDRFSEPGPIFIESGSTLAYFASSLARFCSDANLPAPQLKIVTNNFLAQLSLFGVLSVGVTSGELRHKYLAYLPFNPGARESPDKTEEEAFSDRLAFIRLDRELSQVETIYCTGSTFGFLIGPLSGTRDNAIYKYCLLNNHARRRVVFCIADSKVFTKPRYKAGDVVHHVTHDCFLVFDVDLGRSLAAEDLPEAAVLTAKDLSTKTAPKQLGLRQVKGHEFMDAAPIAGAYRTWLDFLQNVPSNHVEIVIGCSSPESADEVWSAIEAANEALAEWKYTKRYQRRSLANKTVIHCDVV